MKTVHFWDSKKYRTLMQAIKKHDYSTITVHDSTVNDLPTLIKFFGSDLSYIVKGNTK